MLQNFFKIAVRGLLQNKVYTFVNLAGLSLGLTVVIMITLYVKDDLSFDRVHTQGDRIFRLVQDVNRGEGEIQRQGNTGLPQGAVFKAEIPEIENFCRIKNGWGTIVKKKNTGIKTKLLYADTSILSMFSYQVLQGDAKVALNTKNKVVITNLAAIKYFGTADAVGKVLDISDEAFNFKPFVVSAVVTAPPLNASIQFDILLSFLHQIPTDPQQLANEQDWVNASLNTFVLLKPNADGSKLQAKIDRVVKQHTKSYAVGWGTGVAKMSTRFFFQPFFKMHLDPAYFASNGIENWSNALYPKILSGLALLILIIACINFINLTLARSLKRSKEIGIRKVTGSSRNQLIIQFLGESLFITTLAFLPALALVELLLPVFSQLTNKHLESSYLLNPSTILLFGLLLIIVAFLAGFYPALVLSGLNTAKSLKGQLKLTGRNLVGKSLVVAQFVIAAVLMVSMVVLHKQFGYISNADLGYKTDNILRFWLPWSADQPDPTLVKNQLARLPYIKQISSKSGDWNSTAFTVNGKKTDDVYYEDIDDNHLQLMNIPLVKGRYLTYKIASDSLNNFVVNEAFVKAYVPKGVDPLNQTIGYGDKDIKNIVGVVKDFHYGSFKEKISPIVWRLPRNSRQISCIHVEIDGQHKQEALANILKVYRSFVPFQSFDYQFLDDFRMEQYAEDQRWKSILTYTSLIAFLISCLGLFGLASLNIEQRTKEIGIRKILGASVANISTMLSKEFLKLVFLGFVIALPISIYLADWWLKDFAYKINLSWDIFGFVAALMLAVAGITIAYQTIRAANANPAKNLRTE